MIHARSRVWKLRPRAALNACLGPHRDQESGALGSELPVPGGMQAGVKGTQWGSVRTWRGVRELGCFTERGAREALSWGVNEAS